MKKWIFRITLLIVCCGIGVSCEKDEDDAVVANQSEASDVLQEWTISLSPQMLIPGISDRDETASAKLTLLTDFRLAYEISVTGLADTDSLTSAQINAGNPVENGEEFIALVDGDSLLFDKDANIIDTLQLTEAEANNLQNEAYYISISSEEEPDGLLRGQVDEKIASAADVELLPANQVPAIEDLTETGEAYLRLTVENKLYTKIEVSDLSSPDTLMTATINEGAEGEVGDTLVDLTAESAFDSSQSLISVIDLEEDVANSIKNVAAYINVTSSTYPDGLMRGQIDGNISSIPQEAIFELDVLLSAQMQVPALTDREETGSAELTLFNDYTLAYKLSVDDLSGSDQLTVAHIHSGSPVQNGEVVITLVANDSISMFDEEGIFEDTIQLTKEEAKSLMNDALYINVHSMEAESGLVRGQIDEEIVLAADIPMSYEQVIDSVGSRTETGDAVFRIAKSNAIYTKLTVDNLASGDTLTIAGIYAGMSDETGDLLVDLTMDSTFNEEGVLCSKVQVDDTEILETIKHGSSYIQVSSSQLPDGLVRGQINENSEIIPQIIMSWDVEISPSFQVPAVADRMESGTATLYLQYGNTLKYEIQVNDLSSSDILTNAHIHFGNPIENGGIFITLVDGDSMTFDENGFFENTLELTKEQADSLMDGSYYINVHSSEAESGLLRGQLDVEITYAEDIALTTEEVIPSVSGRSETGTAILRLTDDHTLYYDLSVLDLQTDDTLSSAGIYEGITGETGDLVLDLSPDSTFTSDSTGLSVSGALELEPETSIIITEASSYIAVFSSLLPDGLLRGQIMDVGENGDDDSDDNGDTDGDDTADGDEDDDSEDDSSDGEDSADNDTGGDSSSYEEGR
ncbi:CHRD domain-containing protein [Sediminitomix flava]|uniref:CHRD domain-containing protein n=1 Tax=Sediminitomix flava TaxID=379075 RepID=A0A315YVN9_SEDFL|nr:CHRD domain-containing protein [Sediminitomix flava]PWJ33657.1 CHRD domain-containing protein [Sediminitomix flava]